MQTFSFISHPVLSLHEVIPSIIPGIEKVISIHYEKSLQKWAGALTEKRKSGYEMKSLEISGIFPILKKYTEDNSPFSWHSRQNLPFDIELKKKNPEINIFTELENVVLLLRIPDEETHLNALVFIFLNENPANFGITNNINPLTTDNKNIIAYILRNTILTIIRDHHLNQQVLRTNNQKTRLAFNKVENLKAEIKTTRENYGLSLVKLCMQYVKDYSKKNGHQFVLSSSAIEKIKEFKGELSHIELMIKDTVAYLENLFFDMEGEIEIQEMHLQFDAREKDTGRTISTPEQNDKYAKTIQLLDKLEEAALKVKTRNLRMTGSIVGNACQTPVSAPAITDALSNHKSRIRYLIKMYPEKWTTIQHEFRPVKNILREER
ncbi:MAG: hypothetical protein KDC05_01855 [Bacteroidales bacterium]|nr:hypothetical protein [Bacteroidales bacterium]